MTETRKQRRWGLWLVVGLAIVVAYPLSYGPYIWLIWHGFMPAWVYQWTIGFYYPLFGTDLLPPALDDLLGRYVRLFSPRR